MIFVHCSRETSSKDYVNSYGTRSFSIVSRRKKDFTCIVYANETGSKDT